MKCRPKVSLARFPLGLPEFLVVSASFLLKLVIFNLSFLVYVWEPDFTTDLFVSVISGSQFFMTIVVANAMAYLLYKGLVTPYSALSGVRRRNPANDLFIILAVVIGQVVTYKILGQKTLSLSSSIALLAIAANNRTIALLALAVFAAGLPEAIALDEYIPIIFCAVINFFVFLPWLKTKGRYLFYVLCITGCGLVVALATYYIAYRYSLFKLIERIFEQAAPLSWRGSPWNWLLPHGVLDGMPPERMALVMEGAWDAQFKVTYLIVNSPIFGSLFLLLFAYLLGRFGSRTLMDCRRPGSSILKNFLKLKLFLILIEVLGEKVAELEKIIAYFALIFVVELFEQVSSLSGRSPRRTSQDIRHER